MAMKEGKTLQELAQEVAAQHAQKKDWVVGSNRLALSSTHHGSLMSVADSATYGMLDFAHGNLSTFLGIPKAYYDRMRSEQPGLLDENVNTWLGARPSEEKRTVRTLSGNVRALLSDRYRILDNIDLLQYILPELSMYPTLRYISQELTERRMFLKMLQETLIMDVQPGDPVVMGLVIKNSEVGASALQAQGLIYRKRDNTAIIVEDWGQKRHHVGRSLYMGEDGEAMEMYSDETMKTEDKAFFMKVRDTVRFLLTEEVFFKIVQRMQAAAGVEIKKPEAAVAVLARKSGLSEEQRSSVLDFLIKGGDMSMMGLAYSVAALSGDTEDYDAASDLEALSGRIMSLSGQDMRDISDADMRDVKALKLKADPALVGV